MPMLARANELCSGTAVMILVPLVPNKNFTLVICDWDTPLIPVRVNVSVSWIRGNADALKLPLVPDPGGRGMFRSVGRLTRSRSPRRPCLG